MYQSMEKQDTVHMTTYSPTSNKCSAIIFRFGHDRTRPIRDMFDGSVWNTRTATRLYIAESSTRPDEPPGRSIRLRTRIHFSSLHLSISPQNVFQNSYAVCPQDGHDRHSKFHTDLPSQRQITSSDASGPCFPKISDLLANSQGRIKAPSTKIP